MLLGGQGSIFACVALIDISQLRVFTGNLLHGLGQRPDLSVILLVGYRNMPRQQVAERVHGSMRF